MNIPLDGFEMNSGTANSKEYSICFAWISDKIKRLSLIRFTDYFIVTVPSKNSTL